MTVFCAAPDPASGVASSLTYYLDCQARALGENGFQALAGGPLGMSLLSGLITIFIALIGYRLILGETPNLRDGIGWTVRLGFVLALVTSWPAFQTLVYRVAVDGPVELANIVLPASGLPADGLDGRVQQAYDTIRLGSVGQQLQNLAAAAAQSPTPNSQTPALPQPYQFQPPMPQTASLFVLSTAGATGAFRIAIGFLLAVGPLAIMGLLFDATLGLFAGWIRALSGMALAALAALVVTAIDLMVVEGELAHLQALRLGGFGQSMDPQALTTIVIVFALVMLVSTLAAMRMTSAFRLPWGRAVPLARSERAIETALRPGASTLQVMQEQLVARARAAEQSRVAAIAEALTATVRREQTVLVHAGAPGSSPRHDPVETTATMAARGIGLGTIGRRTLARRTRTAARRDVMR